MRSPVLLLAQTLLLADAATSLAAHLSGAPAVMPISTLHLPSGLVR